MTDIGPFNASSSQIKKLQRCERNLYYKAGQWLPGLEKALEELEGPL